jgi:hypothetical protein
MTALAIAVALLTSACGSPTAPEIAFRLIGHGGIPPEMRTPEPGVVVIQQAAEWSDFIKRSGLRAPSGDPRDPIPSINFSSEMAVALLLGTRPTTGYHARIAQIAVRGEALVISAVEVIPCVGATIITYPSSAFAIARSNRRVTVEWSREGPNCE